MKNLTRNRKIRLATTQSVRALLNKNNYKTGYWSDNGRITNLANFSGGDIEVKELYIKMENESRKLEEGLWLQIYTTIVGVEINFWNTNKEEVKKDIKSISKLLEENGYEVKEGINNIEVLGIK